MNNPSIKLLFVLVVLLVWTGVPAYTGDCDDPLGDGSNCQNQELDMDDPLGGDECGGPIVVTSASSSGTTLVVGLSNPTASTEQGFVVATVLLLGQQYSYAIPVSVTARSGLSVLVVFPRTFTTISVYACSSKPGGINEGPDVVGIREEEESE